MTYLCGRKEDLILKKLSVCILFGGVSPEHEVSLRSAESVLNNLDKEKYNIFPVGITKTGEWILYGGRDYSKLPTGEWQHCPENRRAAISPVRGQGLLNFEGDCVVRERIDVVFPVLHGENGEDGSIQGLLQLAGLPYVGPGVAASATCMDKTLTKLVADRAGIRQAAWRLVTARELANNPEALLDGVEKAFSYPVFIKPAGTGSSVGVSKAKNREALLAGGYDPAEIGAKLADNYVRQIMEDGFFHADPHPGNLRVRDGKIVWLDMGMMGTLTERERKLVGQAVSGVARGDVGLCRDAVLGLGEFRGKTDKRQLYRDIEGLLDQYGTADLGSMDLAKVFEDLTDVMKRNGISMPSSLTMLARGLATIEGVVADLNTFMDGGNGLSRDYFVPQVMSALEKDGKLYELPTSFSVQTAYALSSIASQYDTWNVAAVQDAMTQLQEGATVFSNGWTKNMALSNCLSRNLSAFVDWTTGKCEFDSEAFQQLLAFCNSFPAETSDGDGAIAYASSADIAVDDAMWESDATRITNGKQLMSTIGMYSFDSYIWNVYAIRDKITFTGYPTEDGSGSSFELQMPMAISSVTKYPDAAWDFVCSIIKKMNTIDENNYYYGFPISQAAFDAEMTDIMTEQYQLDENGEQVDWDGDGEPDKAIRGSYETMENGETVYKDVYALTQEDIDQILGVISNTHSVYDYDQEILDIITDEVAAYFAGDKDVQTTASMIQSRVNLYVQEQR